MSPFHRLVGFAVLTLAVTACAAENMVRVAPQATRDSLVFLVGRSDGSAAPTNTAYGLSVVSCSEDRVMWTIAADGSRLMPAKIVYGKPVPGFVTRAGPEPLVPGCYRAIVSIGAPTVFDVTGAGQIVPRSKND